MFIFYVYAYLREDGTPYYIGKGKGRRAFDKVHSVKVPKDKSRIVFLERNLSEIGALALERRMIRWYGRKDVGTGTLRNLTEGGDMPPSHKGIPQSAEHNRKNSEAHKGAVFSAETKRLMSEAKRGKRPACVDIRRSYAGASNPNYGKKMSDEQKEKIRITLAETRRAKALALPLSGK
jgi:hypothetical protein